MNSTNAPNPVFLKLIAMVKSNPILYDKRKLDEEMQQEQIQLWKKIAGDCRLENFEKAQEIWKAMLAEYSSYLNYGRNWVYAENLEFMQEYLFETVSPPVSPINFNDNELKNILEEVESRSALIKPVAKQPKIEFAPSAKTITLTAVSDNVPLKRIAPITTLNDFSPLELIFLGYAKSVQKMPLQLQIITKRKIEEIVDDAEMQLLQMTQM